MHIQLPNFHIFNHSFSQYLANDKEQHLSLNRIAKAVRHDRKVFKSLVESMIAGKVEFAVDQWLETSGILAIIASSIGLFGFPFSMWSLLQNSNRPVTRVTTPSDTLGRCTDTEAITVFHLQSSTRRNITTKYW